MSTAALIGLALFGIGLLLVLVIVVRLHAFVALLLTSVIVAILGGIPLGEIADLVQQQMGSTLGYIAVVIGLGAMFGKMLQRSGGASANADRLLTVFGDRRAPWALALTGIIVAIPVFFDVALVLLIPLTANLARRSGRSLLFYAIPLLAGIAVAHSFIPPTPGPVAVAGLLGADLGWVIAIGMLAGIPATLVGGIWFGQRIANKIHVEVPPFLQPDPTKTIRSGQKTPAFGTALNLVALPLVLILLRTVSAVSLPESSRLREILGFIGHPFTALLIATLLAFYFLGIRLGFTPTEVREMASKGLEAGDYSAPMVAAVVIAIASGATVLSHVNDSGFWLVSRYLGMPEKQTFKVWTVMETLVGVTGFMVVLVLSLFL